MVLSVADVRAALGRELLHERPGREHAFAGVTNDSRAARPGELFFAIESDSRDGHAFVDAAVERGVAGVVVHRDILPAAGVSAFRVRNTTHALGELAAYFRGRSTARVVVITGNVGKTTTKELTAAVLASRYPVLKSPANFNDEVGLSMTLLQLEARHERVVLEAGMFERGEIRRLCAIARPDIAVVLNVGPTHLERLGSMEAIAAAKAEAVEALGPEGTAILNGDDPYVAAMAAATKARVLTFGTSPGCDIRAAEIHSRGLNGTDFTVQVFGRELSAHSPLPGRDLVRNALAVIAVALADGFAVEESVAALRSARVEARLRVKMARSGATILDDCYNANPASMFAALDVLAETEGRRVAVLGDMLELGDEEESGHRRVGERAAEVADVLITIGDRARTIAEAARIVGARNVMHFASKDDVARKLKRDLGPGDVVLVKASHGMALETVVASMVAG